MGWRVEAPEGEEFNRRWAVYERVRDTKAARRSRKSRN